MRLKLVDLSEIEYFELRDKFGVPRYRIEIGENIPTVEAIPVDWITKWAKENPANSYSVEKMMKAWEENDG